jgi:hypothetical protein
MMERKLLDTLHKINNLTYLKSQNNKEPEKLIKLKNRIKLQEVELLKILTRKIILNQLKKKKKKKKNKKQKELEKNKKKHNKIIKIKKILQLKKKKKKKKNHKKLEKNNKKNNKIIKIKKDSTAEEEEEE